MRTIKWYRYPQILSYVVQIVRQKGAVCSAVLEPFILMNIDTDVFTIFPKTDKIRNFFRTIHSWLAWENIFFHYLIHVCPARNQNRRLDVHHRWGIYSWNGRDTINFTPDLSGLFNENIPSIVVHIITLENAVLNQWLLLMPRHTWYSKSIVCVQWAPSVALV